MRPTGCGAEGAKFELRPHQLWEQWRSAPDADIHTLQDQLGPLAADTLIAILEFDQRDRWGRGESIGTETYFTAYPALLGDRRAFSLVLGEMYLRQGAGEAICLDEFRRRFPAFGDQLDKLDESDAATVDPRQLDTETAPHVPPPNPDPQAISTLRLKPDWMVSLSDHGITLPPPEPVAEHPAESVSGQRIGPYEIVRTLARGGMGVIYQANDTRLNRPVALKMVLAGQHAEPQALARFRGEALAVARLQHPNIVQIYEVSEHDGLPYIALEFVDGCNLQQHIDGKPLAPTEAAELTRTLAHAVDFAHQRGIIHRDLKPGNILLQTGENGTGKDEEESAPWSDSLLLPHPLPVIPKITDFGLAKLRKATDTHTRPGEVMGTPNYMAPEQADGDPGGVGPAADVYSLGAVLYEMLAGQPPFHGCSPMETLLRQRLVDPVAPAKLVPKVPRDLETICLKCLRKDRDNRYASAAALAEDLTRYLDGEPILARPVAAPERLWKWARRHPTIALLGAVLALLIVVGYALVFFQWQTSLAARNDADRRYHELLESRLQEERALSQAREAVERHTRSLYVHVLTNAELDWLTGDAVKARQLLQTCPAKRRGWEWQYLRRRVEGTNVTLDNAADWTAALTVPSGGTTFTTLGAAGQLSVRELATGRLVSVRVLTRDPNWPQGWGLGRGTFSADGTLVAAVCIPPAEQDTQTNHRVGVWDVTSGKLLHTWPSESGVPIRLAFRGDGQCLAWTCGRWVEQHGHFLWNGGDVRVVDVRTGALRLKHAATRESFVDVAFSPDGRSLAVASASTPLLRLDADTGAILQRRDDANLNAQRVLFVRDGQRVIVQCTNALVQFSTSGERHDVLVAEQNGIKYVFLSPDGKRLAVAGIDHTLRIYDTESWQPMRQLAGHVQPVALAAFAPDLQHLVSQSVEGTAKVWDLAQGSEPFTLGKGDFSASGWIPCSVPDRKGERLYVASDDKQIRIYDLIHGRKLGIWPTRADVRWLALSPDGTKLAAGYDCTDGHIGIWDLATGNETLWPNAHRDCLNCVAFSPDGSRLASACEDGSARVWHVASGRMLAELRGHNGPVAGIAFHPQRDEVATAGADGTLRFWDLALGTERHVVRAHASPLTCCVYSPDGRWLATANSNRDARTVPAQIKLWDAENGEPVRTLDGHQDSIWHLAFHPNSRRLASAGEDWTVKIWDPAAGDALLTLKGHGDDVRCVAFTADGHRLISSGDDPFVRIWDATPPDEK